VLIGIYHKFIAISFVYFVLIVIVEFEFASASFFFIFITQLFSIILKKALMKIIEELHEQEDFYLLILGNNFD